MDLDHQIVHRPSVSVDGPAPASALPNSTGTRRSRWQIVLAGIAGLTVAAFIGVVAWGTGPAPSSTSRVSASDYGTAPTYTLTDQNGRTFNSTTVLGKVQVVSYLFPYCTSFCPLLLGSLVQAQKELTQSGLRGRVAFVAFNVDPERAGPDVMSAFLRQERVDPVDPAWHFLTGPPAAVSEVIRGGFHVFYQKVSIADEEKTEAEEKAAGTFTPQPTAPNALANTAGIDYDVVHNDVVEIVDQHGVIRTILADNSVPTPDVIATAVRAALTETS
jgi:cytochrome oxidase Cu insertion factor (SCO1/SenC/PrrC family)